MAQTINSITSFYSGVFSDLSQIKVSKGFSSIFANGGVMSQTLYVENATQISIDLIRGFKKISKLLQRAPVEGEISLGGNVGHTKAQKFQNVSYDFPIIREYGSVSYSEALKYRLAGRVDTDVSMSVMEKTREKFAEIILTNFQKEGGRMEAQAAEALLTGTCTLDDGGSYDFDRSTSNTIVPSTLWSVTATASPIGDIDDACDAVQEQGKTEASAGIIGYSALTAMVATDEIKNNADNRRFEFVYAGDIMTQKPYPSSMQYLVDNGFKYMAYVKTYKGREVYLFTYNEKYQNSAGTWVDYMNAKDVLIFDHMARRDRYFGPRIRFDMMTQDEILLNRLLGIEALQQMAVDESNQTGVFDVRMFHNDAFLSDSRTSITVETYTGPLFVPTAIDTTALLDGVIA